MRFATTPHPAVVIPHGSKWRAQLDKRDEAPAVQLWGVADGQPEGANGGFFMAGQGYTVADKVAVLEWLIQRERDYVSLRRFEGGACWPIKCEMCGETPCQGCNKCCGSTLGRDPDDGSCLGCG